MLRFDPKERVNASGAMYLHQQAKLIFSGSSLVSNMNSYSSVEIFSFQLKLNQAIINHGLQHSAGFFSQLGIT